MPFGRYKGALLSEIPDQYFNWLCGLDLRAPLREAVEVEQRRRETSQQSGPPINLQIAEKSITPGLRSPLKHYHPDLSGSHESMIAVNEADEWLRSQTREALT